MSNPSKRIGTGWENECLPRLQRIWGEHVDRSAPTTPSNDFHGQPIPVEAKCRKTWGIPDWIRKIRAVASDHRWVILISPRDMRTIYSKQIGQIAVLDIEFAEELLQCYYDNQEPAE